MREGGLAYLLHCFWQGSQQLKKVFLPWIGFCQSLYFLMEEVGNFLEEMPDISDQGGGGGKKGGGFETVLLAMAVVVVVPRF